MARHASSLVSSPREASAFLLGLSAADVMTSSDSEDEHRQIHRRHGRRYISSDDDSDHEGSLRRMAISLQIDSKGPLGWSRAELLTNAPQATASGNTLAAAIIPAERPTSTSAVKPARFQIAQPDAVQPAASDALSPCTDVAQQAEAGAESEAESAGPDGTDDAVLGLPTAEQQASIGDANSAFGLEEDLCSGCLVTLDDEPMQPNAATDQSESGQEAAAQNDQEAVAQNESEAATAAAAAQDGFNAPWGVEKTWWQLHAVDDCESEDDADYFGVPLPWTDSQAADKAVQDAESPAAAAVPGSGLSVTIGPVWATGQAEGTVGQHPAADQATAAAAATLLQLNDSNFGSNLHDDLLSTELGNSNFGSISPDDLSRAELGEFNFNSISQDNVLSDELGQQGSRDLVGGAPSPPAAAGAAVTALNPSAAAGVDTAVASPGTAAGSSISMSATAVDAEEVAAIALVDPSMLAESPAASELRSNLASVARVSDTQAAAASGGSGNHDFLEPTDEEEEEGEYHEEEVSGHDNGGVEHEGELQHDIESGGDARVVDTSIDYTAFLADALLNRMELEAGGRGDQIKTLSKYPCTASLVSLSPARC